MRYLQNLAYGLHPTQTPNLEALTPNAIRVLTRLHTKGHNRGGNVVQRCDRGTARDTRRKTELNLELDYRITPVGYYLSASLACNDER